MQHKQIDLNIKNLKQALSIQKWCDQLTGALLFTNYPAVLAIGGASASGKGYAAELLQEKLALYGVRSVIISTDNYYKGISSMIGKLLWKEVGVAASLDIENEFRRVTQVKTFTEKFSPETLREIYEGIPYPCVANLERFNRLILAAREKLDFDDPDCVDLERAARQIANFKRGIAVESPNYSTFVSEPVGIQKIKPKEYDVLIIEGIYALHKDIVREADLTGSIYAPEPLLLWRRMKRDALRSSFSDEETLKLILTKMLPSYERQLKKKILKSPYISINSLGAEEYPNLAPLPGAAIPPAYRFVHRSDQANEYVLELYAEEGKPLALDLQYSQNGKIFFNDHLIQPDGFGAVYHSSDELIEDLLSAGFIFSN